MIYSVVQYSFVPGAFMPDWRGGGGSFKRRLTVLISGNRFDTLYSHVVHPFTDDVRVGVAPGVGLSGCVCDTHSLCLRHILPFAASRSGEGGSLKRKF